MIAYEYDRERELPLLGSGWGSGRAWDRTPGGIRHAPAGHPRVSAVYRLPTGRVLSGRNRQSSEPSPRHDSTWAPQRAPLGTSSILRAALDLGVTLTPVCNTGVTL